APVSAGALAVHGFISHRPQCLPVIVDGGQNPDAASPRPVITAKAKSQISRSPPTGPAATGAYDTSAPGGGRPSLRWTNSSPSRRKARNDKGCHKVFISYAQACSQNLWINPCVSAHAPPGCRAAPHAGFAVTAIRLPSLTPSRRGALRTARARCATRND